jgi:hypothetical protein
MLADFGELLLIVPLSGFGEDETNATDDAF